MSGAPAAALAAWLHRAVCVSAGWAEDCRRPDGGDHARRTALPAAREILAADDPAATLHSWVCGAEIQAKHGGFYSAGCPARKAHIAAAQTVLDDL